KSGGRWRAGPLAVTAFGTPFMRSTHKRRMAETGQPVSVRRVSVSALMGVRNWRTASLPSAGSSVTVGRLDPASMRSGRIEVKVRKITLLLLGLGAMKNGRASPEADSSYWAAMELTFR